MELRLGQRVPVCAVQAISPPMPQSSVQARPVADTSPIVALPAPASSSLSAAPSNARVVTKEVDDKEITCHVPLPEYPSEAQRAHLTGTVIVRITVWPPNIVKQLTLAESGGNASLDTAAMRAAAGTVCTDADQRYLLFQSFEFNPSQGPGAQASGTAAAPAR
jgi:TonB family protein